MRVIPVFAVCIVLAACAPKAQVMAASEPAPTQQDAEPPRSTRAGAAPETDVKTVATGRNPEAGGWRVDAFGAATGNCFAMVFGSHPTPVLEGCSPNSAQRTTHPVEGHYHSHVIAGFLHPSADGVVVTLPGDKPLPGGETLVSDALAGPAGVTVKYFALNLPQDVTRVEVTAVRDGQKFGRPARPDW